MIDRMLEWMMQWDVHALFPVYIPIVFPLYSYYYPTWLFPIHMD